MKIKIILLLITLVTLHSCTNLKAIVFEESLKDIEVKASTLKSDSKEIHFIEMTHVGHKKFYENIRKDVLKYKKEGYVLFYEFIDFEDKTETETTLRKARKFAGFLPTVKGYEQEIAQFEIEGLEVQKNDMFLHLVNNKDFRADITPTQLVKAYEEKFGEIVLTSEDLTTPLDKKISKTLPKGKRFSIILDYRNLYVAKLIKESKHPKIIVMYGAVHKKGILKELKKNDASWKEIK